MIAETVTQKCPMCAEDIPLDALVCPYCGSKFEVSVKGYCANCHGVVKADANGKCPTCGGELIDRQVERQLIDEPRPAAQPAPPIEKPAAAPIVLPAIAKAYAKPGSWIDRNLLPGEIIVHRTHLHWIKLIYAPLNLLIALLAFMFSGAGAMTLARNPYGNTGLNQTIVIYVPLLIAFVAAIGAIDEVIGYLASDVAITNRRVLARVGGLRRRSINISISDIAGVGARHGLFFFLDCGQLAITSANRRVQWLFSVPRAAEVKKIIDSQFGSGPRPIVKGLSFGKVLLIILGVVLILFGVIVAMFAITTGEWRRVLPAVEVTLDQINQDNLRRSVITTGQIDIPATPTCYTQSDGSRTCILQIGDGRGHTVPLWTPKSMIISSTSGAMIKAGNAYVNDGDRVQVTGLIDKCQQPNCYGISLQTIQLNP